MSKFRTQDSPIPSTRRFAAAIRHLARLATALIGPILMLSGQVSWAQDAFAFNFSAPGINGGGILDGTPIGNGAYLVEGVSASINGVAAFLTPQIPCPTSECQVPGSATIFGNTTFYAPPSFTFDDVLYTGNSLVEHGGYSLDYGGLTFTTYGNTVNVFVPGGVGSPFEGYVYGDTYTIAAGVYYAPAAFSASYVGAFETPQATSAGFAYDNAVTAGTSYVLDPEVATGYSFSIGAGNPNFSSVRLPDLQSIPYEITFNSGGSQVTKSLSADSTFLFPSGGVSSFNVTGIDIGLGVTPSDADSFATTVTFEGNGIFTGTQTPIAEFVSAVPEPSTYVAMLVGLGFMVAMFRRDYAANKTKRPN